MTGFKTIIVIVIVICLIWYFSSKNESYEAVAKFPHMPMQYHDTTIKQRMKESIPHLSDGIIEYVRQNAEGVHSLGKSLSQSSAMFLNEHSLSKMKQHVSETLNQLIDVGYDVMDDAVLSAVRTRVFAELKANVVAADMLCSDSTHECVKVDELITMVTDKKLKHQLDEMSNKLNNPA